MIGVVDKVRRSIVSSRDAVIRSIAELQKPKLDQKIDELLKDIKKVKRVTIKYLGIGRNIGGKLGSVVRAGRSILRALIK
jgi:hypothetical protein